MLPENFLNRMQEMLADEYDDFIDSYNRDKYQALRINTLKTTKEKFLNITKFHLSEVEWVDTGFYYEKEDFPGKHPYHEAGVYYIQEPSAMASAEVLQAMPGEKILDLCSAPGGKSTQIASMMKGEGILICNEIIASRAVVLSENIERMGIRNAIVTNESSDKLAEIFNEYFDRIMVDAPCSGEGMFRKNENAHEEWSMENVRICAERQKMILENAASMLKPGGRIVYSTCTFAPQEDEQVICDFIKEHREYIIEEVKLNGIDERGQVKWCEEAVEGIENTIRLWPHKIKGEGHYVAVLKKNSECPEGYEGSSKYGLIKGISEKECKECVQFLKDNLNVSLKGQYIKFGDHIYLVPENTPSLNKLKVLRPGLHLGTIKKNRFEPSHSLALALGEEDVRNSVNFGIDDKEVYEYISGQTFDFDGEKGWYLINVDGYSLGWGKASGGIMKNHYPKGLRKNLH